jgi:hypothetical protein
MRSNPFFILAHLLAGFASDFFTSPGAGARRYRFLKFSDGEPRPDVLLCDNTQCESAGNERV